MIGNVLYLVMKLHFTYVIKRQNEVKIWRTKDEQWKEGCIEVTALGVVVVLIFGVQLHLKEPVVFESIVKILIVMFIVIFYRII